MKTTITAAQLIELLKRQPPDSPVFLSDADDYNEGCSLYCGGLYLRQDDCRLNENGRMCGLFDEVLE